MFNFDLVSVDDILKNTYVRRKRKNIEFVWRYKKSGHSRKFKEHVIMYTVNDEFHEDLEFFHDLSAQSKKIYNHLLSRFRLEFENQIEEAFE